MNNPHPHPQPRVLIFPFPIQGHVNPMLKLAELLALSGDVHVTFLATEHVHRRLNPTARPGSVLFRTIPDGLPEDHPRSADRIGDLFASITATAKLSLKQLLVSDGADTTCIIADGIFGGFPIEIGGELGIPVIHFRTGSACYFWASFFIPDIIQAGELPIRGDEDKDRIITSVAGMESFLRCRDLPSFFQVTDTTTKNNTLDFMVGVTRASTRAQGLILNTFEDLEGPILSHIRARCNPKTYAVGPIHAHLEYRIAKMDYSSTTTTTTRDNRISTSLFQANKSCMAWLDSQPPKSVIYVSFGSVAVLTRDKVIEFWHGLVNSKRRFLWVVRRDLLVGGEEIIDGRVPHELSEATKERGFISEWVPQEEVLTHVAVGGFLTHSGWNSTLESIVAGVPMICWPCFADQQINSRYVGEVWKLGIDMKDVCDRNVIEKVVNDLMVERNDEFTRSTTEMARLAKKSVSPGGSSYFDLDRLIQDIWLMEK